MASLKENFLTGGVNNGEDKKELEEFWELMTGFGQYAFNRAHSVSYAFLSYYTAYLKCHYPTEFYCAVINCETDPDAQSFYINDAKKRGIEVIPPDINNSGLSFSVHDDKIIYGLTGIKGIGDKAISYIIENKPYSGFYDFLSKIVSLKMKVPKQVIEALIKIGAFDSFGLNRRSCLDSYDRFLTDYKNYIKKPVESKSINFKDDVFYFNSNSVELSLFDILSYEKKYLGIYLSGNPFLFAKSIIGSTDSYTEALVKQSSSVFCEIISIKEVKTKSKNEKMGIIKCNDSKNKIFEFPLFPELYKRYYEEISEGSFIIANFKNKNNSLLCLSVKNLNSEIDELSKGLKSENNIKKLSIKIYSFSDLQKILLRNNKEIHDPDLIRKCSFYYSHPDYYFYIGDYPLCCSTSFIRLINGIENIEVSIER